MRIRLLIIFCVFWAQISAQNIISQVVDSESEQPIPFVNIGIVGKNIGTVSSQLGHFQLNITEALNTDTLRFSMVSYTAKEYNVGDFRRSKTPEFIQMEERLIQLEEVLISSENSTPIVLGIRKKHCYPIPLYRGASSKLAFPQQGYRHELGTRFPNSKSVYLDSVQLNFAECHVEFLEFRVNVYSIENEIITNILSKPIYISLTKEEVLNYPVINLSEYQIEVESDFLITLENHKQIGNVASKILVNFNSKGKTHPTYYRHSSQSDWIRLTRNSKDIGLSFEVFAR